MKDRYNCLQTDLTHFQEEWKRLEEIMERRSLTWREENEAICMKVGIARTKELMVGTN